MSNKYDLSQLTPEFVTPAIEPNTQMPVGEFKDFTKMLSIHEASHFVLGCILINQNWRFRKFKSLNIDSNKLDGNCRGLGPGLFEIDHHRKLKPFYSEKKERLVGIMLQTMAGYSSHPFFIDKDREDFISTHHDEVLEFHKISDIPIQNCKDLKDLEQVFRCLEIKDKGEMITGLNLLHSKLISLFEVPAVSDSIIFVSRQLRIKDGEKIERKQLFEIQSKVQRLVGKVKLKSIVDDIQSIIFSQ